MPFRHSLQHRRRCRVALAAALLVAAHATQAGAQGVVRHPLPNSDFPILSSVEVPAGATTVYLSGAGAPVADRSAPPRTVQAYGDTAAQTEATLLAIQRTLTGLGLGMGDVIKMTVFLAGDPGAGGRMDFDGFMRSYRKFYGTADQPRLPTRSVVQVAALANPGWLVEIEVTAVRP